MGQAAHFFLIVFKHVGLLVVELLFYWFRTFWGEFLQLRERRLAHCRTGGSVRGAACLRTDCTGSRQAPPQNKCTVLLPGRLHALHSLHASAPLQKKKKKNKTFFHFC